VPYDSKFEDYYLPAALEAAELSRLDQAGRAYLDHLGAHRPWCPTTGRPAQTVTQRVARFITDYLFTRVDKLQVAGFDAKWKTINHLRATVPGLTRFPGGAGMVGAPGAQVAGQTMKTAEICLTVRVRAGEFSDTPRRREPLIAIGEAPRLPRCLRPAERLDCLDKLSHDISPPPAASGGIINIGGGAGGRQLDRQRDDLTP